MFKRIGCYLNQTTFSFGAVQNLCKSMSALCDLHTSPRKTCAKVTQQRHALVKKLCT